MGVKKLSITLFLFESKTKTIFLINQAI